VSGARCGTCARVAKVIEEEFGVRYPKGHVSRSLRERQWTPQRPIRRAARRDEGAIRHRRDAAWPDPRRRARRERRVLVLEDESGFYLLPGVVRTYAPEARTPVLHETQTRDHLSVMGGMTPEGNLYVLARQRSLNGLDIIEFLLHLGRVAGDRLLIIWDGSPIHRRAEVNKFVSETRGKLWVEVLPGYAPDLNPWDEGGWHHLKDVEMSNLVCRDLEELLQEFHLAAGRLRQKPEMIGAFFSQAGLKLESR
jgi:transposase